MHQSYIVCNADDLEDLKALSNYVVIVSWTKINAGGNLEKKGSLQNICMDQWILRVISDSVSLTFLRAEH